MLLDQISNQTSWFYGKDMQIENKENVDHIHSVMEDMQLRKQRFRSPRVLNKHLQLLFNWTYLLALGLEFGVCVPPICVNNDFYMVNVVYALRLSVFTAIFKGFSYIPIAIIMIVVKISKRLSPVHAALFFPEAAHTSRP